MNTLDFLKNCPFCNGGRTDIREIPLTNQPRMDGKPSAIVSVEIRHYCDPIPGLVAHAVTFRGRDKETAIAAWNRRHDETPSEFERLIGGTQNV